MNARRTIASLFATAVAVTGFAATAGSADAATATVNYVQDGGFEASTYAADGSIVNAQWASHDTAFDASDLCLVGSWCEITDELGNAPEHGNGWAWFGYTPDAHATGFVKQTVDVPVDGVVQLSYNYRNGSADAPYDATLTVKVDDKVVGTNVETRGGTLGYQTYYAVLDLAAGTHELSFEYDNGSGNDYSETSTYNNMTVDDVAITPVG